MILAILGVGLIGGSIALAARERGLCSRIFAWDREIAIAQEAVKLGAASEACARLEDAVGRCDLAVLAVPPDAICALLPQVCAALPARAALSDVGSVKAPMAAFARNFARYVPGHPMAGRERHGLGAARGSLFEGATWALTPVEQTDRGALESVAAFVSALGAAPLTLSSEEHDEIVALTSHGPHVLAFALSALAKREAVRLSALEKLAAGGFHSATRVAASDPALWSEICLANDKNVARMLRALQSELDIAIAALESGDRDALEAILTRGHKEKKSDASLD